MPNKTVKLAGSRSFQDIGTVGQNAEQLAGNMQSVNQIMDVGLRNSKNFIDSWVRVSDMVALGFVTLNGDTLTAATFGGGSGTVNVQNSISGDGSVASPLELQGDVPTPGNSFYYGTDSGGTKGWFVLPGGGSSPLTTKGDLFTFSTVDARLPVGTNGQVLTADSTAAVGVSWQTPGGGVTPVPATIPDLTYWFQSDAIAGTTGFPLEVLENYCPWTAGRFAGAAGVGVTIVNAGLNGLNTVLFPGTSDGRYAFSVKMSLAKSTIFTVSNGTGTFIDGSMGALQYDLLPEPALTKCFVVFIGAATITPGAGVWFQGNATYDSVGGAFAFRVGRTAAGSGSNSQPISVSSSSIGFNPQSSGQDYVGGLAEVIVYNRVLSPTEIVAVENYLFAKWGV